LSIVGSTGFANKTSMGFLLLHSTNDSIFGKRLQITDFFYFWVFGIIIYHFLTVVGLIMELILVI
jgi:hypothetical protein